MKEKPIRDKMNINRKIKMIAFAAVILFSSAGMMYAKMNIYISYSFLALAVWIGMGCHFIPIHIDVIDLAKVERKLYQEKIASEEKEKLDRESTIKVE